jgi:hypothetical protein
MTRRRARLTQAALFDLDEPQPASETAAPAQRLVDATPAAAAQQPAAERWGSAAPTQLDRCASCRRTLRSGHAPDCRLEANHEAVNPVSREQRAP